MSKTNVKRLISRNVKKLAKIMDKKAPEILIGCGLAGFATTILLVNKAAPKAAKRLEEVHEDLGNMETEPTKSEVIIEEIKAVAPIYIPSVITGVVSTACILGSYKIGSRRTAAVAAAYEITQASLIEYKDKVKDLYGEKKADKVETEIIKDHVAKNPPPKSMIGTADEPITDGKSLFYDEEGGRWFRCNVDKLRQAEKAISDRLTIEMWVPLNDFYYELGLSNTTFGDMMGFTVDHGIDISTVPIFAPDGYTHATAIKYEWCLRQDYDGSARGRY